MFLVNLQQTSVLSESCETLTLCGRDMKFMEFLVVQPSVLVTDGKLMLKNAMFLLLMPLLPHATLVTRLPRVLIVQTMSYGCSFAVYYIRDFGARFFAFFI